jgi:Phosphoribosyl-AMP cyclohydrolase
MGIALDFDKQNGLITAVVQDASSHRVLMVGYMNQEAFDKTVSTGHVTFFSRSRQKLWTKGESSAIFFCSNQSPLIAIRTRFSFRPNRPSLASAMKVMKAASSALGGMASGRPPKNPFTIRLMSMEAGSEAPPRSPQRQSRKRHV